MMRVNQVLLACDTVECGYRLVSLDDGRMAFVWGNIRARVGDYLPAQEAAAPTCDHGVEVYPTSGAAAEAWIRCSSALRDSGAKHAANELLAAAEHADMN